MNKYLFHKWTIIIVRSLFGLNLLLSGFLVLFHLVELPPSNAAAEGFISSLIATGYLWEIIKGVEIIIGLLLLLNYFTPLSLIIIFPISVNIFLFNVLLWPDGAPSGIFILAANLYLLVAHLPSYQSLFKAKSTLS